MMKRTFFYLAMLLIAVCACHREGQFTVEGCITEATDSMLYLEHISLDRGVVTTDSVRLDSTGIFAFRGPSPSNPEFYRLRIADQGVNLAVDSTETIRVEASMENLSFGYRVEGSGASDTIRMLCLRLAQLERDVRRKANDRSLTIDERDRHIRQLVADYKAGIKHDIIAPNLTGAASYFACFQMLAGQMLFDPMNDRDDLKWMRAVANTWHERFPQSPRTENLVNIVAQGRRNQAPPRQITIDMDDERVSELGIIDMTFPDIQGNELSLSSLRGKVVLLDFTAYGLPGSSERMLRMRSLYEKFHSRGLEIYQVSVDPDRHVWAQCCENLPWKCVYCDEGPGADMLTLYQVQQLPCYFLIDRNCDLHARQEDIPTLEQAIEALL